MGKKGLLLLLFIILIASANAATFYVSTSGSDSASGSQSSPWRTIQHAVDSVSAGDTIYVRSGTYYENIVLRKSGTSSAPITLASNPGETVTIDAGSGHGIRDSGGQSYWIIDGFTIVTTGSMAAAVQATSGEWGGSITNNWIIRNNNILGGNVLIRGHHHLVENNDIDGQHISKGHSSYQTGIRDSYGGSSGASNLADITHHNTYKNNNIRGFYRSGIWTMKYTHDHVIEGNTVSDIYGTGTGPGQCINIDSHQSVAWRHVIKDNQVIGCGAEGIQLENCFECLVENNILEDCLRAITVISYSDGNCDTVTDGNTYGDRDYDNSCKDEDVNTIVRQNVIFNSGTALVNYGMDGIHYISNSVYNTQSYYFNYPQYNGHVSFVNNIIQSIPSTLGTNRNNLLTNNPGYVNPSAGDLSLSSSATQAIDQGADISSYTNEVTSPPATDYAGNARIQGAAIDIGAYEYAGAPPTDPVCPDGTCEGSEDCNNCPKDCGPCGSVCPNTICETGEGCNTCPQDCGECSSVCPNTICEADETCSSCPNDCGTCPTTVCILGDVNCDGHVNLVDLVSVAQNFRKTTGFDASIDVNKDGIIDLYDLVIVARHFT